MESFYLGIFNTHVDSDNAQTRSVGRDVNFSALRVTNGESVDVFIIHTIMIITMKCKRL